ncbi:unnamed protein product [Ilex paraguariensis]|uniref:Non-specific lipid-transfer protein n=1 Tax=Ilex paraguariensis TaxID=185542 RepID=A0ABC8TCW7_9AQUA
MSRLLWSLAILLLVARSVMSAPSCTAVVNEVQTCLGFLQGNGPSPACCSGVKDLKNNAKTKADRVAICNCIKNALSNVKYDPKRLTLLPQKCGVNYNLPPIDQKYDCSTIPMERVLHAKAHKNF